MPHVGSRRRDRDRHKDLSDYLPLPGSGCIFVEEQTTRASMTAAPPVLLDDECFEYPPDDARCSCRAQVRPLCSASSTEGVVRTDSALLLKVRRQRLGLARSPGPWGDAAHQLQTFQACLASQVCQVWPATESTLERSISAGLASLHRLLHSRANPPAHGRKLSNLGHLALPCFISNHCSNPCPRVGGRRDRFASAR